ncbi:hypothetical protein AB0H73_05920 [Streptomyces olivoreticuli]
MTTTDPGRSLRERQLSDLLNAYTTTIAPGPWAAPRPSHLRRKTSPTIADAFHPDAAYPLAERKASRGR